MNKKKDPFKTDKPLYDYRIKYDISALPQDIKELINELEEYDKDGNWLEYDLKFEILETSLKGYLRHNVITSSDFNTLLRKYGWYV